jgi:hypothetical protein
MDMEVKHGLTGLQASIDHQPIAARDTFLLRYSSGHDEELAQQIRILRFDLVDALNVLVGDDEDVSGRLRAPIVKGCHVLVLVDNTGWALTSCDTTEGTGPHRMASPFK